MAGCVLAVSFSSSSVPSKQILEMEKPRALSASSRTARATGYFSASSLHIPGYCEAWPGNTNATLPIVNSSPEPSCDDSRGRELLLDFFVDARAGKARCHADSVFHRFGVRTAVADDANAAHTQERRATVLRVINRLPQALQSAARKQKTDLRRQRTLDRLFQ